MIKRRDRLTKMRRNWRGNNWTCLWKCFSYSNWLSSLNFSPLLNVSSQTDIPPVTGAEATTVTPADIY